MVPITQKLPAHAKHHRAMPDHKRRKSGFAGRVSSRDEAFQKLPVREAENALPSNSNPICRTTDPDARDAIAADSPHHESHAHARYCRADDHRIPDSRRKRDKRLLYGSAPDNAQPWTPASMWLPATRLQPLA